MVSNIPPAAACLAASRPVTALTLAWELSNARDGPLSLLCRQIGRALGRAAAAAKLAQLTPASLAALDETTSSLEALPPFQEVDGPEPHLVRRLLLCPPVTAQVLPVQAPVRVDSFIAQLAFQQPVGLGSKPSSLAKGCPQTAAHALTTAEQQEHPRWVLVHRLQGKLSGH